MGYLNQDDDPQDIYLGGPQRFPNPEGLAPRMDTEGPPPTKLSGGAKLTPIPTDPGVKQDISNPDEAHTMAQPDMVREASAHAAAPASMGEPAPPDPFGLPAQPPAPALAQGKPAMPELQPSRERYHNTLKEFGNAADNVMAAKMALDPSDPGYLQRLAALHGKESDIKREEALYKEKHPWGTIESAHPGVFGKIGHAFGQIGNVAAEALAPGLAQAIPGSHANLEEQVVLGDQGVEAAGKESAQAAGAGLAGAKTEKAAAEVPLTAQKVNESIAKTGEADAKTDALKNPHLKPDEQVLAAGTRIAQGKGTDEDLATVQSYHQLQQEKAAGHPEKVKQLKQEYEEAVKAGDINKAKDLLQMQRDFSAASQPPHGPPKELGVNPEGTVETARPGTKIAPGTKSVKDTVKGATNDEERRADLARNMNENLDQLEDIVKRRPDMF